MPHGSSGFWAFPDRLGNSSYGGPSTFHGHPSDDSRQPGNESDLRRSLCLQLYQSVLLKALSGSDRALTHWARLGRLALALTPAERRPAGQTLAPEVAAAMIEAGLLAMGEESVDVPDPADKSPAPATAPPALQVNHQRHPGPSPRVG